MLALVQGGGADIVFGLLVRHHHAPRDSSVVVVEMIGEIDIYTAPTMRDYLLTLIAEGHIKLVVDFRDVEFLDSAGLRVLMTARNRVHRAGGALVLSGLPTRLLKILTIVEFTDLIWIRGDTDAAAALFADLSRVRRPPSRRENPKGGWSWLTSKIYLASADNHEAAEAALGEVIRSFGLQVNLAFQPIEASWFREFLLKVRKHGKTTLPVEDQLDKLVRAIEMQTLHRPQAEIDATQSDAVAKLIAALDKTPRAVVQIGSVLLVKADSAVVVRNLTQLELAHWERNPGLFRDPEAALSELQRATNTQNHRHRPPPAVSA
jgi:anti-anti-sigma factor